MKKKILIIFTGAMELGGIERSLLGLLDAMDYEEYDVDLFLYAHHGPLYSLINDKVNILPEVKELAYIRESFSTKLKNGCYYSALLRIRDEFIGKAKKINRNATWAQIMRKYAPKQEKHYDIALSFFRPFDYIVEKVDADIKVGWIHTDYSTEKTDYDLLRKDYEKVDYIAGVSDQCSKAFTNLFPGLANKVITIGNIVSKEFIEKESQKIDVSDEMPNDGCVKLLSVGRFCNAKNFDNLPYICKKIKEMGISVKWYIIGFGGDEPLIRQRITEAEMQDSVILLGKKENPYPYMRACDLYVQPSRYEGKCVSVIEAQLLGKPVVITRYATSASQLEDGVDGMIVSMSNDRCAEEIVELLKNPQKMNQLAENCSKRDYTNAKEIEKIYSLIS